MSIGDFYILEIDINNTDSLLCLPVFLWIYFHSFCDICVTLNFFQYDTNGFTIWKKDNSCSIRIKLDLYIFAIKSL